jgi:hypothetical protein
VSRNRQRSPRTFDHIVIRLTEAIDRIATALDAPKPHLEAVPQVQLTECR